MTICISAICTEQEEEHIVFAVDHMITTPNGEFEHAIKKYKEINKNTVGMLAGQALLMDFFMDLDNFDSDYETIQNTIENKFKEKRLDIIQKTVLDHYLVDVNFVRQNLTEEIKNPFIEKIFKHITNTTLDTAILLIGFCGDSAQISEIGEGGSYKLNDINFHAIGSGADQARNTLLFQKHSSEDNLATTLYNVYKAKKNAEVKQGVGRETEIGYLNKKGMKLLNQENINILDDIYYIELNCGKEHKKLNELNL